MGRTVPQTAHGDRMRTTFLAVLTRFEDVKRSQAGGETFGTVHFRKRSLLFLNPSGTDSVPEGPYVLQVVNELAGACFQEIH